VVAEALSITNMKLPSLLLLLHAGAGVLQAQTVPSLTVPGQGKIRSHGDLFDRFDANADGFVAREEILAKGVQPPAVPSATPPPELVKLADSILSLDIDGDKKVSKKEWQLDVLRFDRLDINADGTVVVEELVKVSGKKESGEGLFKHFDANTDGKVSKEEWKAAMLQMLQQKR
jgi:hypothetical protein